MPELPEIVAHAERLSASFSGAELSSFRPLHLAALKTVDPDPGLTSGVVLTGVGHRGKYLTLTFGEDYTYVVHLMQGGRLRPDPSQARRPRGGMARWTFADGRALLLTEAGTERKAGVWLVAGTPTACEPLDGLGPDAHSMSRDRFAAALQEERVRLHGFLRTQRRLAGIGRLLANEILHSAGLSPFAVTDTLDDEQIDRLHTSVGAVIADAIEHERRLDEIGRSVDRPNRVHHRVGLPCPVCDDEIRAVEYRRYTVAYCPTCQTGGRVLADNTTSRFLK